VVGDVTGNVTGNATGNAGTATALQTGRTFTIGSTGKTFDGSANVAWTLAEIGVNNATLTLATSGIATGSQTFTANQGTNATFTVNVPATDLSVTGGTTAGPTINSSTGTNATIPTASASASGAVTTNDQTFAGVKTFGTALAVTGTSNAAGRFYAGTTNPTNTTRVNYDGALHATSFVGNGSGLTNLPSSAPTTAQVGAATAGLADGAVGSYAALTSNENVERFAGHTRAGSGLRYVAFNGSNSGTSPSGTWRLMGYSVAGSFGEQAGSVWLRIS
jgi:hypothetical protein